MDESILAAGDNASLLSNWLWPCLCLLAVGLISVLIYILWIIKPALERKTPLPPNLIPMAKGSHWLWGHLKYLGGALSLEESFQHLCVQNANAAGRCSYFVGAQAYVTVLRWQDAQPILHAEFTRSYPALLHRYMTNAFGNYSIILLRGRTWKYERANILRALHPAEFMTASRASVQAVTASMVTTLKERIKSSSVEKKNNNKNDNNNNNTTPPSSSLEMPLEHVIKMIALDVMGATIFDDATLFNCCATMQLSPLAQAFENLLQDLVRRVSAPLDPRNIWPKLFSWHAANRQFLHDRAVVRNFLQAMLKARQEQRRKEEEEEDGGFDKNHDKKTKKKKDLLTLLMQAHEDAERENFNSWKAQLPLDEIIQDVTSSILFAGHDTTTITLTYAIFLISRHPDVERNCLEELQRVMRNNQEETTTQNTSTDNNTENDDEDITPQLVYLHAVIQEALRLYAPGISTSRNLQKDQTLYYHDDNDHQKEPREVVLPKGCTVYIPIYGMQRQECNFAQPLAFRPDRWVKWDKRTGSWVERHADEPTTTDDIDDENYIPPGNPKAMLAFSAGARSCPGAKFAMMEAVLILAGLLPEFQFTSLHEDCQPERNGIVQRPKDGLPMRISLRNAAANQKDRP